MRFRVPGITLALYLLGILYARDANAGLSDGRPHANIAPRTPVPIEKIDDNIPVTSPNGTQLPPYSQVYQFLQPIDHNDLSLGTFHQRFWFTSEFYEPGGPIILMTPGEVAADGYTNYLTNKTLNGMIAQQQKGATVVLEHRFFGFSNPYNSLDEDSLKYLTVQQAIDDLAYFSQNVQLPMPYSGNATSDKAPWILMGGSYSGALASWTMVNHPGVFYAGYASSAVVQATTDFWAYFEPIRLSMPANCSNDVQAVINYVDAVFLNGAQEEVDMIKSNFGLGDLSHLDDVAGSLRNNLWAWQSLQPDTGANSPFYQFCDALEVSDGKIADDDGFGLDHALQAWGKYWNETYYRQLCGDSDAETCLGTYDSNSYYYTDIVIQNPTRSWEWLVCNELGFFQDGPSSTGVSSISSILIRPEYNERQCTYWFPRTFTATSSPRTSETNTKYGGWNASVERLFFANGRRDPWRDATVSSDMKDVDDSSLQVVAISDGFHCSDLLTSAGQMDTSVRAVQEQALEMIASWLGDLEPN